MNFKKDVAYYQDEMIGTFHYAYAHPMKPLRVAMTNEIVEKYMIGTTKDGGTIFWYVDCNKKVRHGQIIYYKEDGHRDKSKHLSSVPSKLRLKGNFEQCIFGEHLLNYNSNIISFVESPKTSIIADISNFNKDSVWVSYTMLRGLTYDKLNYIKNIIKNKEIHLSCNSSSIFGKCFSTISRIVFSVGNEI